MLIREIRYKWSVYFGGVIRRNKCQNIVATGELDDKRVRGRQVIHDLIHDW